MFERYLFPTLHIDRFIFVDSVISSHLVQHYHVTLHFFVILHVCVTTFDICDQIA